MSPVMAPTGSLTALMNELKALEETIAPGELVVYRWQPFGGIQLPAVYNWLGNTSTRDRDIHRIADDMTIFVRVGVAYTDQDQQMADLERYADITRIVLDTEFRPNHRPLNQTATKGRRTDMQMIQQEFNGVGVLAIQFPLLVTLDRVI